MVAQSEHDDLTARGVPAMGRVERLHIVTGKGGTGKTTVAAALALALAAGNRRTLLVEVEGRQAIAQVFGSPPLPYEERVIARVAGGGEVRALAVDPEEALLEYLDMFYRLGVAGRALRKMGAIDFATTIAPGVRDVLLTGKVKEAVTRTVDGRRVYDAVVLDAPPTGRIGPFLNVTAETARLAKVGPIKTQSEGVTAILRSPMTAVHLVTLLEEMPVQETADTIAELSRFGLPTWPRRRSHKPGSGAGWPPPGWPPTGRPCSGCSTRRGRTRPGWPSRRRCAPNCGPSAGVWSSCPRCRTG